MEIEKHVRNRYSRQTAFSGIGDAGQEKLLASLAVIIGCGALGSNVAMLLARAGVGRLRIIDRDFVEEHNLHRQVLFTEEDVRKQLPKAVAAEQSLMKANSTIQVDGIVADVNSSNIEEYCHGATVILDGLDNFETRYLINDIALKHGIPWVYGGSVGSSGMTMTIVPGKTACLRCAVPVMPERGTLPTCETAGVINTIPAVIGALQANEALKLIVGTGVLNPGLTVIDLWQGTHETLTAARRDDCPACHARYEFLDVRPEVSVTSLCGQSRAVQVVDHSVSHVSLDVLARKLIGTGAVYRDAYVLRLEINDRELVIFPDGRAIVKNTLDEEEALGLYNRYVAPAGDEE